MWIANSCSGFSHNGSALDVASVAFQSLKVMRPRLSEERDPKKASRA
jgi:hypothetical protein